MGFNQTRSRNSVTKEILKFPAGLDAIKSIVVKASGLDELPSAVPGMAGVYGIEAGTPLKVISGDDQGRYEPFDGTGTVAGILGEHIFLDVAHDSPAQDAQVDLYFHGCVFDKRKIVGFDDYESDLRADLATCRFE
jgi:hypothetical protein